MEINVDLNEKLSISDIELGIVKENPKLIDLDIIPSKEEQIFNHDGEYGYDVVKVAPVTADADTNIKAENIKSGVNILGVEGALDANALDNFLKGTLTSIAFPKGMYQVRPYTFYQLSSLKEVTDWGDINSIQDYAFRQTGLTEFILKGNRSIASIGSNAFYNCPALTNVEIDLNPSSYTSSAHSFLGSNLFYNCKALKTVKISYNDAGGYGWRLLNTSQFSGCSALEFVRLKHFATIYSTSGQMFYNCTGLKIVRFDDVAPSFNLSQTSSNNYLFRNCTQSDLTIYIDAPRATVETFTGYEAKWGATNATIICNDDPEWVEYEEE